MVSLLWTALALAQDPAQEDEVDAEVIIEADRIALARAAVVESLRAEGYSRSARQGEYTVFKNKVPYKPQVWLHDDGWVSLRRQPPRVHSPFRSFADQGSPAEYLLCVIMPTACVSVGGWLIGERKLARQEQEVYDATREEVKALGDAVARRHLDQRLAEDIPRDLQAIWTNPELPADTRRALLFAYWDTRTETRAGLEARAAVRDFLVGVVQASPEPFGAGELEALNARRHSAEPLDLALAGSPR